MLLDFLTDQGVIGKILQHLHRPLDPPSIRPARPPTQTVLPFD